MISLLVFKAVYGYQRPSGDQRQTHAHLPLLSVRPRRLGGVGKAAPVLKEEGMEEFPEFVFTSLLLFVPELCIILPLTSFPSIHLVLWNVKARYIFV